MAKRTTEVECFQERRECAAKVDKLAENMARQVALTESKLLPALEKIDAVLAEGARTMRDHEIRIIRVEERQATNRIWSKRGWILFSALVVGTILAVFRKHLG